MVNIVLGSTVLEDVQLSCVSRSVSSEYNARISSTNAAINTKGVEVWVVGGLQRSQPHLKHIFYLSHPMFLIGLFLQGITQLKT